jgi:hypothetical protein
LKIPEYDHDIAPPLAIISARRPSTRREEIAVSISAPSLSAKIIAGGISTEEQEQLPQVERKGSLREILRGIADRSRQEKDKAREREREREREKLYEKEPSVEEVNDMIPSGF